MKEVFWCSKLIDQRNQITIVQRSRSYNDEEYLPTNQVINDIAEFLKKHDVNNVFNDSFRCSFSHGNESTAADNKLYANYNCFGIVHKESGDMYTVKQICTQYELRSFKFLIWMLINGADYISLFTRNQDSYNATPKLHHFAISTDDYWSTYNPHENIIVVDNMTIDFSKYEYDFAKIKKLVLDNSLTRQMINYLFDDDKLIINSELDNFEVESKRTGLILNIEKFWNDETKVNDLEYFVMCPKKNSRHRLCVSQGNCDNINDFITQFNADRNEFLNDITTQLDIRDRFKMQYSNSGAIEHTGYFKNSTAKTRQAFFDECMSKLEEATADDEDMKEMIDDLNSMENEFINISKAEVEGRCHIKSTFIKLS